MNLDMKDGFETSLVFLSTTGSRSLIFSSMGNCIQERKMPVDKDWFTAVVGRGTTPQKE